MSNITKSGSVNSLFSSSPSPNSFRSSSPPSLAVMEAISGSNSVVQGTKTPLEKELRKNALLSNLERGAIAMQKCRDKQSETISFDLEMIDGWVRTSRKLSEAFISNLSDLKNECPSLYNHVITRMYAKLRESPIEEDGYAISHEEIEFLFETAAEEASKNNITNEAVVAEMEGELFALKQAETQVLKHLKDGHMLFSPILTVLQDEMRRQEYRIDELRDSNLNTPVSDKVLVKPIAGEANSNSLRNLWQRVTGSSTPFSGDGIAAAKVFPTEV